MRQRSGGDYLREAIILNTFVKGGGIILGMALIRFEEIRYI